MGCILDGGGVYTSFGPDPFTAGNLREVKTFVATDEVTAHFGIHNLLAGIQFETNTAVNGFMQGGNGYYVFSSWDDFVNGAKPSAYAITTSKALDGSQFKAKMKYNQFSFYVQDQVNLSDRFRLTGGLRFEVPSYPSLEDNFNVPFSQLTFRNGQKFSTDQLPGNSLTVEVQVTSLAVCRLYGLCQQLEMPTVVRCSMFITSQRKQNTVSPISTRLSQAS